MAIAPLALLAARKREITESVVHNDQDSRPDARPATEVP